MLTLNQNSKQSAPICLQNPELEHNSESEPERTQFTLIVTNQYDDRYILSIYRSMSRATIKY